MELPPPKAELAGCMWLPRIIAKARLLAAGRLPPDYENRFCHPSGVDGQFLGFFGLSRDEVALLASRPDEEIARWFTSREPGRPEKIQEWNRLAVNLGRPGFPMADRMPVAMSTTYKHLAHLKYEAVFEVLEADERSARGPVANWPAAR
jgi:hypothetical protein